MNSNVNPEEIKKFNQLSASWWDPDGPMQVLHVMNPLRLDFINRHTTLKQKNVLDVGCGGGLLTEALARAGATATGIDLSPELIRVASAHAQQQQLTIDYQTVAVETLASQQPESMDLITCMEMLEHVPDPQAIIHACTTLLKPNGQLFLSTINRTPRAFLLAIAGAEYLLNILPKGTHHYGQFIRPSELDTWTQAAGCSLRDLSGIHYSPFNKTCSHTENVSVNYLACYQKGKVVNLMHQNIDT